MRKRLVRGDAGVALVEFALVAPVLLFLMIGIFDVGRAVNAYVTISNAAREGSHYLALHPAATLDDITSEARAWVVPLNALKASVTAECYYGTSSESWPCSGAPAGSVPVRVSVTYDWNAVTVLIGAFFPSPSFTASSTADVPR